MRNLIQRTAGHRPIVWNQITEVAVAEKVGTNGNSPHTSVVASEHDTASEGVSSAVARTTEVNAQSVGLWIVANNSLDAGVPWDLGPIALTNGVYKGLAVHEKPLRLVMACPQGTRHTEVIQSEANALIRLAEDEDIAGAILWYLGGEDNRYALERLRSARKALVFVDREPPPGFEADFVGVHNVFAAATAVRYLIGLGHRNIVHLTNSDRASTVSERMQGYQEALRESGIAFRPEYVVQGPFKSERDEEQIWAELIEYLRALPEPPTAAFAVNDYAAFRLIRALRSVGLRVPEDMAVVGFDDSERWSSLDPFMTSVSQPFEQIGSEAARLLMARLSQPQVQTYRHVLLSASLVVRGSST
jgi:DNA-binding LacI/PurR family transcriptional regulator